MIDDALITVVIDDLAFGGDGVGSVLGGAEGEKRDKAAGMRCFIPYTIPGEKVRARIVTRKARYLKAEVVEIIKPSSERIRPECSHFGICGGCSWQHIDYPRQLKAKENILRQNLRRIGGFDAGDIQLFPSPDSYGYRCRARFQVSEGGSLSFIGRDGNSLVPLEACPILHPELEKLLADSYSKRGKLLLAQIEDDGKATIYPEARTAPFMQANKGVNTLLQKQLLCEIDRSIGDSGISKENVQILDLYCGNGNLSLPLFKAGYRVQGYDTSPKAIQEANRKAQLSAPPGALSTPGAPSPPGTPFPSGALSAPETPRPPDQVYSVEDALKGAIRYLRAAGGRRDRLFLIIDPPRKGLGGSGAEKIASLGAESMFYISCDPASLSRDLSYLARNGYNASRIQLFDMFPQTSHLETLLVLEKGVTNGI